MGFDHHAEGSIVGGGLEGDMAVSRYVRSVRGAEFPYGIQTDNLRAVVVHHHTGAERDRVCDGVWRDCEYPDRWCAADIILSAGYLRVGVFLQLPERDVELVCEQCGYIRKGVFPQNHHAAGGGDNKPAVVCDSVGYFCGVLHLLRSDWNGIGDSLADCAVPAADPAVGADGGRVRYDFLVHDDKIQGSADHAGEDHLAVGVYHAGDLSAEYGDEREVASGYESEPGDAGDGSDQVFAVRCG